MTVRDLIAAYVRQLELEGRPYARVAPVQARALLDALGHLDAGEVTADMLDEYAAARLRAGRRPATVRTELWLLGRAYRVAVARGRWRGGVPVGPRLRVQNARQGFLAPSELAALVRALEPLDSDVADLVRLLGATGWRRGEVAGLRWLEVDLAGGVLRLPGARSKSGQPRVAPLAADCLAMLRRRWAARPPGAELVFWRRRTRRPVASFRGVWRRACAAIGRPELLVHDLRRSFARSALLAGVAQHLVLALGGWRTQGMLLRYAIVDEGSLREAVLLMDAVTRRGGAGSA